jgi:hypothetical protein
MKTAWELKAEAAARVLAEEFMSARALPELVVMLKIAYLQGACAGLPTQQPMPWARVFVRELTHKALG